MSLIRKGANDFRYEPAVQTIARQLLKGQCVLFLGAGASIDSTRRSLPSGQELSKELAVLCKLDWHDYIPLSTIAFYYESYFTRNGLNELLMERIDADRSRRRTEEERIQPSTTITRLMSIFEILEARDVETLTITTNYDRHFERAYENTFKRQPEVVIYRGGWNPNDRAAKLHFDMRGVPVSPLWMPKRPTSLYKMHGCISQANDQSLVVTEEDYINFLTNALGENPENRLLWYVKSKLETSVILFLGYSLSDWNFRTIFKATVERRENKETRSYAVQFHHPQRPDELDRFPIIVDFWHDKRIDIVNLKADEFVEDLLKAVEAEAAKSPADVSRV